MLYQPTNITPSALGALGNGVIDANNGMTVSWQVNGSSKLLAYIINIYENTAAGTLLYTTGYTTQGCPFSGKTAMGNDVRFSYAISSASLANSGISNGNDYKLTIRQYWGTTDYIDQNSPSVFLARSTPQISVTGLATVTERQHTFTFSLTGTTEALNWVRYRLRQTAAMRYGGSIQNATINYTTFATAVADEAGQYTFSYNGTRWTMGGASVGANLDTYGIVYTGSPESGDEVTVWYGADEEVYDSGNIYGVAELLLTYDGLISNSKYAIQADVQTASGQTASTGEQNFSVSYIVQDADGSCSACTLWKENAVKLGWPALSEVTAEVHPHGNERYVASMESVGLQSAGEDNTVEWVADEVFYHADFTMNAWLDFRTERTGWGGDIWQDIKCPCFSADGEAATAVVGLYPSGENEFTVYAVLRSYDREIDYFASKTFSVPQKEREFAALVAAVSSDTQKTYSFPVDVNGETQYAPLTVQAGADYAPVITCGEEETTVRWNVAALMVKYLPLLVVFVTGAYIQEIGTFEVTFPVAIGGVDVVDIVAGQTEGVIADEPWQYYHSVKAVKHGVGNLLTEGFDTGTYMYWKANSDYNYDAGLLASLSTPYTFSIYRRSENEPKLIHVGEVDGSTYTAKDFGAKNSGGPYQYIIFAEDNEGNNAVLGTTDPITPCFDSWALLSCEETGATGEVAGSSTYVVQKAYRFRYNLSSGTISSNNTPNIQPTFTQYPNVQMANPLYHSGTLQGLIGSVEQGRYSDTAELRDELMALGKTGNTLFLKSRKGDLWEVRISGPVTVTIEDGTEEQAQQISVPWVEIGSAEDVGIIG